jgi:hypothetical protein
MSKRFFEKGAPNDGNGGGRRAGSRNRLQTSFLEALAEDLSVHGIGAIRVARVEKPIEYLKVIASVLPRELQIETNAVAEMTDEDIAGYLAILQRMQMKKEKEETSDEQPTEH